MVQATRAQSKLVLHAFNEGQHSPAGTGAGVPSGQIFRSRVQKVFVQFEPTAIQEKYKLLSRIFRHL